MVFELSLIFPTYLMNYCLILFSPRLHPKIPFKQFFFIFIFIFSENDLPTATLHYVANKFKKILQHVFLSYKLLAIHQSLSFQSIKRLPFSFPSRNSDKFGLKEDDGLFHYLSLGQFFVFLVCSFDLYVNNNF